MSRLLASALALVAFAGLARAATLDNALPAYASPDDKAVVIGTAAAGSRIVTTPAPSGWQAVELAGPHTVYVTEKDTLKNFEVRPGASYYAAPKADAPVIGLADEKDSVAFADIAGRYNKFSLSKPIVAYVRAAATPVAPIPAPVVAAEPVPAPADYAPVLRNDIPASTPTTPGQGRELGEPRLARTFFGVVASTRNPLRPRRPHDFQLNDAAGSRIAYIDISRLLLTEQLETFVGRPVAIFGTAEKQTAGGDIVIHAETIKLQ